jgi:hypothetical protein
MNRCDVCGKFRGWQQLRLVSIEINQDYEEEAYAKCLYCCKEQNPDLPINFIKDTLVGMEEFKSGKLEPYVFGEGR